MCNAAVIGIQWHWHAQWHDANIKKQLLVSHLVPHSAVHIHVLFCIGCPMNNLTQGALLQAPYLCPKADIHADDLQPHLIHLCGHSVMEIVQKLEEFVQQLCVCKGWVGREFVFLEVSSVSGFVINSPVSGQGSTCRINNMISKVLIRCSMCEGVSLETQTNTAAGWFQANEPNKGWDSGFIFYLCF